MATADAIADMGRTLKELLDVALPGIDVVIATPDEFKELGQQPTLSIFLYHVGINPELRNGPPRATGNTTSRPPIPLDLRYLLTPWVRNARDAHSVVGRVLQALYDRAVLGTADLIGNSWEPEDTAQIVLESLPVGEHYSIWEPTDLPYRLSLTYLVRIVGISPAVVTPVTPVVSAEFGGV